MAQQDIIIDFIVDDSGLDTAVDQLERMGVIDKKVATAFKSTTAEINKQEKALKNTAQAVKAPIQSLEQLDKKTKSFVKNFVEGFHEGVNEALDEAGVSLKEFTTALENAGVKGEKPVTSLRQELKNLTQDIAAAKASGGPVSPEMLKRAGQLKDAIADANKEISNVGSDTRNIDNIVGSVAALAGGFSAVQGAIGLFSDDSEELQKVLLKVNSAMALATGIQQIANAVQKEGSLAMLATTVATKAQIVTQQIYTAVTGKATAATTAFKFALAATGIGLAILLVTALADAFSDTDDELEDVNHELDVLKAKLDGLNRSGRRDTDLAVAQAKARGAKESEVQKIIIQGKIEERNRIRETLAEEKRLLSQQEAGSEAAVAAQIRVNETKQLLLDVNNDIAISEEDLTGILRDESKQQAEERKRQSEKALEAAKEARRRDFEDFKAKKELELLKTKEGSEEQLAAKKEFLRAQLFIDLEAEKITENQQKLLIQKFFKDRLDLDKEYNRAKREESLEQAASELNAELQSLNLSNERKLELTEEAIRVAADLEILAVEDNASKIAEINAKRDRAIREARLESIRTTLDYDLQITEIGNAKLVRALTQSLADQDRLRGASSRAEEKQIEKQFKIRRLSLDEQLTMIKRLSRIESEAIGKRIDALNKEKDKKLISQKQYDLEYKKLVDHLSSRFANHT